MADRRIAALLTQMAATASIIDGLIAKAKGEGGKKEPSAPLGLGNGSRVYVVTDWMPTCSKCAKRGRCGEKPRQCGMASWFPIEHRVSLTLVDGLLVGAVCQEGRKGDKGVCRDGDGCRHVARVVNALTGKESRGVELSTTFVAARTMPKCPNCRETWGITERGDGRYECRSPVCARDGKSWVFGDGTEVRPKPMRHELVIMDRDPGRLVVKH